MPWKEVLPITPVHTARLLRINFEVQQELVPDIAFLGGPR